VPHSLLNTAERLAQELGITRNAALVQLAEEGAAAHERHTQIAALASEHVVTAVGIFDGMYGTGYLERLRCDEQA